MTRREMLATIDELSLILEKAKVAVKCITVNDVNADDIQVLAHITDEFLCELGEAIQAM